MNDTFFFICHCSAQLTTSFLNTLLGWEVLTGVYKSTLSHSAIYLQYPVIWVTLGWRLSTLLVIFSSKLSITTGNIMVKIGRRRYDRLCSFLLHQTTNEISTNCSSTRYRCELHEIKTCNEIQVDTITQWFLFCLRACLWNTVE